jgi:hypothetical protein
MRFKGEMMQTQMQDDKTMSEMTMAEISVPPAQVMSAAIRSHMLIARNPDVDEVLRRRAIKELQRFKSMPEVAQLLAQLQ